MAVSQDGVAFTTFSNALGEDAVFEGPAVISNVSVTDTGSVVARIVRVYPESREGYDLALKWEVYGCSSGKDLKNCITVVSLAIDPVKVSKSRADALPFRGGTC